MDADWRHQAKSRDRRVALERTVGFKLRRRGLTTHVSPHQNNGRLFDSTSLRPNPNCLVRQVLIFGNHVQNPVDAFLNG